MKTILQKRLKYQYTSDFWSYEPFSFGFEDISNNGYDDYDRFAYRYGLNFNYIVKDIERTYPEYYKYKPKGTLIEFPYDYATFRGENGTTRVELYYGIPMNKVRFSEEEGKYYSSIKRGTFFHDRSWNRIVEDIQDKDMEFEVSQVDTASNDLAVDRLVYYVKPDTYFVALELQDYYSFNAGGYHDTVTVDKYDFSSLQLSDIQPAYCIKVIDSAAEVTQDNLNIDPNPNRIYYLDKPLYFYCEIYNLFVDMETGNTKYAVDYSVKYAGEEYAGPIKKFLKRILFNQKYVTGVQSTHFTMYGKKPDEILFLKIDHKITEEGPYSMTVRITDTIAKKSIEKSVLFALLKDETNKNRK
jgi:hypothetical protein